VEGDDHWGDANRTTRVNSFFSHPADQGGTGQSVDSEGEVCPAKATHHALLRGLFRLRSARRPVLMTARWVVVVASLPPSERLVEDGSGPNPPPRPEQSVSWLPINSICKSPSMPGPRRFQFNYRFHATKKDQRVIVGLALGGINDSKALPRCDHRGFSSGRDLLVRSARGDLLDFTAPEKASI